MRCAATNYNRQKGDVFLVFEYIDYDLQAVLSSPDVRLTPQHVQCLMRQLLQALHYIHINGIMHRDIKGACVRGCAAAYVSVREDDACRCPATARTHAHRRQRAHRARLRAQAGRLGHGSHLGGRAGQA